jgi:protein arginine N-methyltransferase 1
MGYFLLYESMLDSVLWARDRWLRPGGEILPDRAVMYAALIEDESYYSDKIEFWDDVYGVDMSCVKPLVLNEPLVDSISHKQVVTDYPPFLELDLKTVTPAQLQFQAGMCLRSGSGQQVRALTVWFECYFSAFGNRRLSTSPFSKTTHWKQTTLYLPRPLQLKEGEEVRVRLAVGKCGDNPRHLNIKLGLEG